MGDSKKSNVTLKRSLTDAMQEALNAQILMEARSSYSYLAAASWCEKEGYEHSAQYLYTHANEEREHMLKIFRYVNEAGGHAIAPSITNLKYKYDSLRQVFEHILEHEISVTHAINELVDSSFSLKDFATFQFLQWFVTEQREEEKLSRRAVEIFDIIGEKGQGLWLIDKEIGRLDQLAHGGGAK